MQMVERPRPSPKAGEVLVRIHAVACAVGRALLSRRSHRPLRSQLTARSRTRSIGTRRCGRDGVDPRRIGQRVSIEPQKPDPTSPESKAGRYNLCPHMEFFATPPIDGALTDYVTIGADFAHPIADSVSYEAAALFEPLSVGIASAQKAGITAALGC